MSHNRVIVIIIIIINIWWRQRIVVSFHQTAINICVKRTYSIVYSMRVYFFFKVCCSWMCVCGWRIVRTDSEKASNLSVAAQSLSVPLRFEGRRQIFRPATTATIRMYRMHTRVWLSPHERRHRELKGVKALHSSQMSSTFIYFYFLIADTYFYLSLDFVVDEFLHCSCCS